MVKILELAISKVQELSEADQEVFARDLLRRVEALEALRAEIDIGLAELDAGLDRELDIDEFLKQMHEKHAGGH
jgi:hypothetical protein